MKRQRPTREQMLTCSSITEAMRKYRMGHGVAKRLMQIYGIDYGYQHTLERSLANEKQRHRLALTIRRMKAQGVSDRKLAEHLRVSVWQIQQARREYEIGHTHGENHG